jgi:hypothetical protein
LRAKRETISYLTSVKFFEALSIPFCPPWIAYSSYSYIRHKIWGDWGKAKYGFYCDALHILLVLTSTKHDIIRGCIIILCIFKLIRYLYGFTGELRRNLHFRLGLPLDRPLLRTSNALTFGGMIGRDKNLSKNGISYMHML